MCVYGYMRVFGIEVKQKMRYELPFFHCRYVSLQCATKVKQFQVAGV